LDCYCDKNVVAILLQKLPASQTALARLSPIRSRMVHAFAQAAAEIVGGHHGQLDDQQCNPGMQPGRVGSETVVGTGIAAPSRVRDRSP
jgi:hypothetical protein